MNSNKKIRLIVAPHDPSKKMIKEIKKSFPGAIEYTRLRADYNNERIIVVDTVGALASLYNYGQISYVGGSFKEGVHNVMEAAVYGVPVVYGPVLTGSTEAEKMSKPHCGGIIVENDIAFSTTMQKLISDEEFRKNTGKEAQEFVMKRLGASKQISNLICDLI